MQTMITSVAPGGPPCPAFVAIPSAPWHEITRRLIEEQAVIGRLPEQDLIDLVRRSQIRTLRARERIYRQGDAGRTVIAVLDGYVKLTSVTGPGREVVLDVVRAGGSFGELEVLNNWPRECDAVTLSRCRVLVIDGRLFTQLMERTTEASRLMVHLISDRLRLATQRLLDTIALPATARIAKTLLHLAELQCPVPRDGIRLNLRLSQSDLGGMTGLTRESINKHLAAMRDAGWISLASGTVTLRDIDRLERCLNDQDTQRANHWRVRGGRNRRVHERLSAAE